MGVEESDHISLPGKVRLFPLSGTLLLPAGQLPLNIFEKRYLAMIEDALKDSRLIGMIQPKSQAAGSGDGDIPLFDVGCAGRIVAFEETDDGRYLVTLKGISRFRLVQELPPDKGGYRQANVDWAPFAGDLTLEEGLGLDRGRLRDLLGRYFKIHRLSCDWEAVDSAADHKLVTCLSMICPLGANEKQALLEADCCRRRGEMLMAMIDMAVRENEAGGACH